MIDSARSNPSQDESAPRVSGRLRAIVGIVVLLLLLAAAVAARLLIGRGADGVLWGLPESSGILRFRVNASLTCLVAGSSLGVSGLLLQSLLRNPLASPFILGLSAGAGLGMTVATWLTLSWPSLAWLLSGGALLPAAAGALLSLGLVVALGHRRGVIEPLTLVLAGVIVSALAAALTLLVQHLLPLEVRGRIDLWMLGRVPEVGASVVLGISAAVTLLGVIMAWRVGHAMDAASLSDPEAISVGVDLPRLRTVMLGISALLAASATALCGPLAFIGLVGPHLARMTCGPRHRVLVIGAAFAGALLLLGADAVRQAIDFGAGRLQIGVVTAILGSIAFLWLLRRFQLVTL